MLELREHRHDPVTARDDVPAPLDPPRGSPSPRAASGLRSRLGAVSKAVSMAFDGRSDVDRFAELASKSREPEEVRVELVRLAWSLSGAARVELYGDREGRASGRLACWPPSIPGGTSTESRSNPRGPIGRSVRENPGPSTLQIPLKAGDTPVGVLRLIGPGQRPWPARIVRRLETLCAIASTAERSLRRPSVEDPDTNPGAHGSTLLAALLTFAQAQARRRHESLSLLEVAVDRIDSISGLLGDELAEESAERVARAIKSSIRASDIVARLGGGRIAVLLPNTSPENALKVAEAARVAIARSGSLSTDLPHLTASIGLATYPDHAHDVASLRAAASSALTRAKDSGQDQLAAAPPMPATPANSWAHCLGWNG